MITIDRIRQFLNEQIGPSKECPTRAHLARKLGLEATKATRLFNFLKGADPQASAVMDWFQQLGGRLFFPDETASEVVYLPKVAAKAGAGESWVTSGECLGFVPFDRGTLDAAHIMAGRCVIMDVVGDSMEPLIKDGDTLLVDQSKTEAQDGRIYVVSLGDTLMVKRLTRIPYGWRLCSENRLRGDTDVVGDELDILKIDGLVRWCGHFL